MTRMSSSRLIIAACLALLPLFQVCSASSLEAPSYKVVSIQGDGALEIRRYQDSVWISTAALEEVSFVRATSFGMEKLVQYIQGENAGQYQVPMTVPVLTGIKPSDGPFCATAFTVRFFVPRDFQADPPVPQPELQLGVEKWEKQCFAVRSFSGFADDANVAREASRLADSLKGSKWAASLAANSDDEYIIAQYNAPWEVTGRRNEVWMRITSAGEDCLSQLSAATAL